MNEDFLHFIWRSRLFSQIDLTTTNGQIVQILKTGEYNTDSGPDFSLGTIRIGSQVWIGNVEIHIKSSDWYLHRHHEDEVYDSVILHVCWEIDKDVFRRDDTVIPQIELKSRVDEWRVQRFYDLQHNLDHIPCSSLIPRLEPHAWKNAIDRMYVERLEERSEKILMRLKQLNGDWNQVYWEQLCSAFGMKTNKEGFLRLAELLKVNVILHVRNDQHKVEALLFGVAGLLSKDLKGSYAEGLRKEFKFQLKKNGLAELNPMIWKFMRMRPNNFPTIRLAQLAGFICKYGIVFKPDSSGKYALFEEKVLRIPMNEFWDNHYTLTKASNKRRKQPGPQLRRSLVANFLVPMYFTFAKYVDNTSMQDQVLDRFSKFPPEINRVTRRFTKLGLEIENLWDSQSVLHLHNNYCTLKRCTNCIIGKNLLSNEEKSTRNLEVSD